MVCIRASLASVAKLLAVLAWIACGGEGDAPAPPIEAATPERSAPAAGTAEAPRAQHDPGSETEIDPSSISRSATIKIKEYQAAFIGSGTLGKGTLTWSGKEIPFRIGGLGVGGIGVAAIDASGTVYNLTDLGQFPGTYGNARIGATAADVGKGRLWLKNTKGVVIELRTDMQGLALTGGVDGIVIAWEADVHRSVREAKEGTGKAWEATAKGAKGALDTIEKPFQ